MSNTIDHLRALLRLAESAQQAQDDDLARAVLAAAEILARDNPPINTAPMLECMRALAIDENGAAQFPRRGPLVNGLQEYCGDGNPPHGNMQYRLPDELAGYRLMYGLGEVQDILPEELEVMSF